MVPLALVKKVGSKPDSRPSGKEKHLVPPKTATDFSSDDEQDWEDESAGDGSEEDNGVDEVGFEKLIRALGDNGLNEFDQASLAALTGGEEGEEENEEGNESSGEDPGPEDGMEVPEVDEAEEEGSDSGSKSGGTEEGGSSDNEEFLALDELEDVELHPDAVPRRGIGVIDNKVRVA